MRNLFRPIPCALVLIVVCVTGIGSTQPPPQPSPPQPPPQQPTEIVTTITGEGGAPPHFAVGTFVALSNDGETQTAARTITEVLWDDLN
jgi:hypothetical protein